MSTTRADIIAQLQKEILPLQGFRSTLSNTVVDVELGPIKDAFPNASFPLGAIHEFICASAEDASASGGFIAGVLASLMRNDGVSVWISSSGIIFPPALKTFGIAPEKIIFVDLQKERDVLWTMIEALKCDSLAAVVGEIQELNLITSRRLQLAVEQSRVTGFLLRRNPHNLVSTACVARWKITSLPSIAIDDIPGIGFPCWDVELLKIRNGKPGRWQMYWADKGFQPVYRQAIMVHREQRKTG